jgi:hypothetical protein
MPVEMRRLVSSASASSSPPVYCCGACYDVAVRDDATLEAQFQVDSTPLLFTMSESLHRPYPIYTQCVICDRYVFRMVDEVDIVTRILAAVRAREKSRSLHAALQSQPSWIFHGMASEFRTTLATLLLHADATLDVDALMTHIHSLQGIPSRETIRCKMLMHFAWNACDATDSPCDATYSPCDATDSPCDVTDSPCDATYSPCDATYSPCDATYSPCDVTDSPCDATDSPCDVTDSPCDAT